MTTNEWLKPIRKDYKEDRKRIFKVRTTKKH
jgi:hypothetical protein